ncbi:hypothetical protein ABZ915_02105 [Streptomyces sp. NPDC046915]|uniref:hypothetical protein n=1 Tax=Streptomyces sp. NPDC046915 TaxID=3155257 RepID=UPI0033DC33E2
MPSVEGTDGIDFTAVARAPQAQAVFRAVLEGRTEPLRGAADLTGLWSPVEILGAQGDAAGESSHPDSFDALALLVFRLLDEGHANPARRLAELQWQLARRIGTDEIVLMSAANLAQALQGDPVQHKRRLELLEFAVPQILTWDQPPAAKAALLSHLATARRDEAGDDPGRIRAVIAACQDALALEEHLGDATLAELHLAAGTAHLVTARSSAEPSAEDLRAAIGHLYEAVARWDPQEEGKRHADALTSLGLACLGLGRLTEDTELLNAAVSCFQLALRHEGDGRVRARASAGLADAEGLLRDPAQALSDDTDPRGPEARSALPPGIAALFADGDAAFAASRDEGADAGTVRARAVEQYLAAARRIGRSEPPRLRAELYHRMATLALESSDEDELWTGVCFAAAARRLSRDSWKTVSRARVKWHLAEMLMKISPLDGTERLLLASRLMVAARPHLEEHGLALEAEQLGHSYRFCVTLLAAQGDTQARAVAVGLHRARQSARIEGELQAPPRSPLHARYLDHLRAVRAEARDGLETLLADGEIHRVAVVAAFGLTPWAADELVGLAECRKDAGDLTGALDLAAEAEEVLVRAAQADRPASGERAWCAMATLYAELGQPAEARRCLDEARSASSRPAAPYENEDEDEVSEGDVSEGEESEGDGSRPSGPYRQLIEDTAAAVRGAGTVPRLDPVATARVVEPRETARPALARALEARWGGSTV